MFGSRSVVWHLTKGAFGVAALVLASLLTPQYPWALFVGVPAALIAFRGCPLCWTMGLVETVSARLRGDSAKTGCVDGRCGLDPHVRE